MKQGFAILALCLVAITPIVTRGATPEPDSLASARAYILQSERDWTATNPQALALVKRILAEDYVWIDDGKVYDRAGTLKVTAAGPGDVVAEQVDSLNLRFFGATAVVQGTNTSVHRNGRKERGVFIDTWVLRNGRWQIVASADMTVRPSR